MEVITVGVGREHLDVKIEIDGTIHDLGLLEKDEVYGMCRKLEEAAKKLGNYYFKQ